MSFISDNLFHFAAIVTNMNFNMYLIVLGFGIIFSLFCIYLFIFMQSETKCFNSKNLTIKNVIH